MEPELLAWMRESKDRDDIRRVITAYFLAIDRHERERLGDVFAADGRIYVDGTLRSGPGVTAQPSAAYDGFNPADIKASNHVMGQCDIHLDGDSARSETYAVAYLLLPGATGDRLLSRGLRYHDRLRREPRGWRIVERRHHRDWMVEHPTSVAVGFAERAQFPDSPGELS
jgi:hypothetical protein